MIKCTHKESKSECRFTDCCSMRFSHHVRWCPRQHAGYGDVVRQHEPNLHMLSTHHQFAFSASVSTLVPRSHSRAPRTARTEFSPVPCCGWLTRPLCLAAPCLGWRASPLQSTAACIAPHTAQLADTACQRAVTADGRLAQEQPRTALTSDMTAACVCTWWGIAPSEAKPLTGSMKLKPFLFCTQQVVREA